MTKMEKIGLALVTAIAVALFVAGKYAGCLG